MENVYAVYFDHFSSRAGGGISQYQNGFTIHVTMTRQEFGSDDILGLDIHERYFFVEVIVTAAIFIDFINKSGLRDHMFFDLMLTLSI